jgi:hypothetical protein
MKAALIGTVVPADRYHYVMVRLPDGSNDFWLLTQHDLERVRMRATKYEGVLPPMRILPKWKHRVLRLLGVG